MDRKQAVLLERCFQALLPQHLQDEAADGFCLFLFHHRARFAVGRGADGMSSASGVTFPSSTEKIR